MIRRLEAIEIIFKDKETIWVIPRKGKGSSNLVFNRWWGSKGSYSGGWYAFRKRLHDNKVLDINEIHRLARTYDIYCMGTLRKPNLEGRKIIEKGDKA